MAWDHPTSGERCLDRGAEFLAFRDGLICEVRAYYSRDGDLVGFDHARARPHRAAPASSVVRPCPTPRDFATTIAAAYAVEGPVDRPRPRRALRRRCCTRDAEVQGRRWRCSTRHGLHRRARPAPARRKTLQGNRRAALARRGCRVFVADVQGRRHGLCRPAPGRRTRRQARRGARSCARSRRLPGRVPRRSAGARSAPGVPVTRDPVTRLRPAASRKVLGATRRRSRASGSSSTTPTRRRCRCWTSATCARC